MALCGAWMKPMPDGENHTFQVAKLIIFYKFQHF